MTDSITVPIVPRLSSRYVFLAAPLLGTGEESQKNVREALLAADRLVRAGWPVWVPHLCIFWDIVTPQPRDHWMALNRAWMRQCGALVRLEGGSVGSDLEEGWAQEFGIPVFHGVDRFLESNPEVDSADDFELFPRGLKAWT